MATKKQYNLAVVIIVVKKGGKFQTAKQVNADVEIKRFKLRLWRNFLFLYKNCFQKKIYKIKGRLYGKFKNNKYYISNFNER